MKWLRRVWLALAGIRLLRLEPGDVLVVSTDMPPSITPRVLEWLQPYFPDTRIIVLPAGFDVDVVHSHVKADA